MEDRPDGAQQSARVRFYDLLRDRQATIAKTRALGDEWLIRAVGALDDAKAIRVATDPPPSPRMLVLADELERLASEAEQNERRALELADEMRDDTSALAEQMSLRARELDLLEELIEIATAEEAAGRDPMAHPAAVRLQATLALLTRAEDMRSK
jgi:hypothetical protein